MDTVTFMKHLHTYRAPRVFNPWRDYEPGLDIGPSAPEIRYHNLQRYLELRLNAHYLFIAEGLGYQGGRFSGMAMTSERILLGHHPEVRPEEVLGEWNYQRTSNPDSPLLKEHRKHWASTNPRLPSCGAVCTVIIWEPLTPCCGIFFPFTPIKKRGC